MLATGMAMGFPFSFATEQKHNLLNSLTQFQISLSYAEATGGVYDSQDGGKM
ncbi:hypothetical protein P775_26640 [Puniceibacterium antarcticum]|uniref:Uncharacterized protein n=1 Tax=Puniceibacterium antarcticum TaxID=1206336 RepID=A0A2G8QYA1_9RHOB|nr:hypothetical protein P775_26640 [Puniceibacterium antarcticum]